MIAEQISGREWVYTHCTKIESVNLLYTQMQEYISDNNCISIVIS